MPALLINSGTDLTFQSGSLLPHHCPCLCLSPATLLLLRTGWGIALRDRCVDFSENIPWAPGVGAPTADGCWSSPPQAPVVASFTATRGPCHLPGDSFLTSPECSLTGLCCAGNSGNSSRGWRKQAWHPSVGATGPQ